MNESNWLLVNENTRIKSILNQEAERWWAELQSLEKEIFSKEDKLKECVAKSRELQSEIDRVQRNGEAAPKHKGQNAQGAKYIPPWDRPLPRGHKAKVSKVQAWY